MNILPKSKPNIDFSPHWRAIDQWIDQASDTLVRRNRLDFLATFALFAGDVASRTDLAWRRIAHAVDYGLPAIDAISTALGVKKSVVRFLRGKDPALVGPYLAERPRHLSHLLDRVAPHHWPSDQSEWKSFNRFYQGAIRSTEDPDWARRRLALRQHLFLDLCAMGYRNATRRLNSIWPNSSPWDPIRELVRALEIWVWHQATCQGFNPVVARQAEFRLPSDLLISYSAVKIHEMAACWQDVSSFFNASMLDREVPNWPALIRVPIKTGDLSVVSLVSRDALINESEALSHCSWMYVRDCVKGAKHIVSIRDSAGTSLSTAELRLSAHPIPMVSVVQHRAEGNRDPSESCARALSRALDQLSDPACLNWIGYVAAQLRQWKVEIEGRLADALELTVHEGIQACLVDVLPDYSNVLKWIARRLEDEEGLFRHRNDLAEEQLKVVGLADENTHQRWHEVGYFDPTIFDEMDELGALLKGKNFYYESLAETWVELPFWHFLQANRA